MADVLLFHHAQGLTTGVTAFADALRAAGHRVTVPDLYDGATFASLDDGVAHARKIGLDEIVERGVAAAADLPEAIVYGGFSLGNMPAQKLAQTRPGARGAVLYHGAIPSSVYGTTWPAGVPLQLHVMEGDEWGDVDDVRRLAAEAADGELHVYPGDRHLFTDRSLDVFDEVTTALVLERTLAFLARIQVEIQT
jgi:dienelactone hydrolase